jgi:PIN domain nuclease of toxin-antitoxin system
MRLLLDTVTLIRAVVSPQLISKKAFVVLKSAENIRQVSSISLSELAIKQGKGKLTFSKEDALAAVTDLQLQILPYTKDHALALFNLPWHHSDPFDRQIIAQAVAEGIPVVTSDRVFKLYEELDVIW